MSQYQNEEDEDLFYNEKLRLPTAYDEDEKYENSDYFSSISNSVESVRRRAALLKKVRNYFKKKVSSSIKEYENSDGGEVDEMSSTDSPEVLEEIRQVGKNPKMLAELIKWKKEEEEDIRVGTAGEKLLEFDVKKALVKSLDVHPHEIYNLEEEISEIENEQKCEIACQNGGSCFVEGVGLFGCDCAKGFGGNFCENDINECELNDTAMCGPHEKCVNTPGSYSCSCQNGYTLTKDQLCIGATDCRLSLCQNGGECMKEESETDGHFSCVCSLGFAGELCEDALSDCKESPCSHNMLCIVTEKGHNCVQQPDVSSDFIALDVSTLFWTFIILAIVIIIIFLLAGGLILYMRRRTQLPSSPPSEEEIKETDVRGSTHEVIPSEEQMLVEEPMEEEKKDHRKARKRKSITWSSHEFVAL